MTWRERAYRQLDPGARDRPGLSQTNKMLCVAILIGAGAAIVETEPTISDAYASAFALLELLLGLIFTIEYFGRFWVAAEAPGPGVWSKRWRFARSPAGLTDLFVTVVTLLPFIGPSAMPLRLIRLLRILRLAKLGRTSAALAHIRDAVASRRDELLITLIFALVWLVIGATLLYWLEADVQPEKFGSIPRSLWWAAVTLTTIGYGDVYPLTAAGKVVASLMALMGIGLVAMPTGIIAAAFSESFQKARARDQRSIE